MDFNLFIRYASSFAILIPVITGLWNYRRQGVNSKYFIYFLLAGFIADQLHPPIVGDFARVWVFNLYVLFEVVFLIWFIRRISKNIEAEKFYRAGIYIMIGFWLAAHFIFRKEIHGFSSIFSSATAIIISCIAAYELLRITQREENLAALPEFWFLTGIFFYFFCANFLFGFLQSEILTKIWFLHNIINIITYLIYTKGFLCIRSKP